MYLLEDPKRTEGKRTSPERDKRRRIGVLQGKAPGSFTTGATGLRSRSGKYIPFLDIGGSRPGGKR